MSSHSTSASAATTANQALISLVTQLNDMVQEVIWSQSQEEKMDLSWKIAFEVVHLHVLSVLFINTLDTE